MSVVAPRAARFGLALAFALVLPLTARAQSAGFAINRFDPAERGSDWFAGDSLDLRGNGRLILGVTADFAQKPLVLYDPGGDERASVIEHQFFAHLGLDLVLWERLRLGANLPLLVHQAGESGTLNGVTYDASEGAALADVRLAADVRLLGKYRAPASIALGAAVFLPTGDQDAFASDGEVRVLPRLLLAGDLGQVAYSAKVGVLYRDDRSFGGASTGTELVTAAALGVRVLEQKLLLGPELFGSTVVSDEDALFARRATPFELIFGAHYLPASDLRIGAGFGPGLTRGFGSPEWRALLSFEWVNEPAPPRPAAARKDRDRDGILDGDDACPDEPGVASDDPAHHGCPRPVDRDRDGILDAEDACPDEPGVKSEVPEKNGCPRQDRDQDGVFDDEDACLDVPGVRSDDAKTNGCPPDTDGDGIPDPVDACPRMSGPSNADPKKHGCPAARIERGQIKILERVEFEYNSAKLSPGSTPILEAVLAVMQSHPELGKLSVEGHTDSRGQAGYNLSLSQWRAAAVVRWLVDHGVEKQRLSSQGFGMARPIDRNDSEDGRQNNRRVEFHILENDGKPVINE